MKLITDSFVWDDSTFEAYVEGMCRQIESFPHEKVAFWAPTTPEVIFTLFAVWKMGRIACPINIRLPTAPLDLLQTEIFTPTMPSPIPPKKSHWEVDRLAICLSTSGSTATPKIAQLTLANLIHNAQGANTLLPLKQEDIWGLTLPLFHVSGIGILLRSYLAQSAVSLNLHLATRLSAVPTQLYRLLLNPPPLLQTVLLGGAPLPELSTPWHIVPTYGMTEMSSQIVTAHQILPSTQLKIAPDKEIWVKGPTLFQGYLHENRINSEEWFATGDLGRFEKEHFHVIGRKDNLFISGGENIQPEEIEETIRSLFTHQEVVIIPVEDRNFGQRPSVFLTDPALLPIIQKKLARHLPKYKIPIRAFPFPSTTQLKPNRKMLIQIANNTQAEKRIHSPK